MTASIHSSRLLSTPHLVCMNVLVYRRACDAACIRCRSGEINYVYGYIYKCMLVFATVNNVGFVVVAVVVLLFCCSFSACVCVCVYVCVCV